MGHFVSTIGAEAISSWTETSASSHTTPSARPILSSPLSSVLTLSSLLHDILLLLLPKEPFL